MIMSFKLYPTSTSGEVNLCLECEDGEGQGDPGGGADSHQDGIHVVGGGHHAQHHRLKH